MSDKVNEQADKMREMAQATLDKARDAVSQYMAESQKMREKADSGVRASYSSVKEMNESRRVCQANSLSNRATAAAGKDPQEMGPFTSHLKEQMEK